MHVKQLKRWWEESKERYDIGRAFHSTYNGSYKEVMKGRCLVFPVINLRETGVNLHRIMDKRGITPKEVKKYLYLTSVQSVYNWFNGLNMPTIDNLYALSQLLQVPIDTIVRGNRKPIIPEPIGVLNNARDRRLYTYCKKLNEMLVA